MALPKIDLSDPRNTALIQAVAQQVFAMLPAGGQQAVDLACDARRGGMAATTGVTPMSNGNGCACKIGNGGNYPALMPAMTPSTVPGGGYPPQYPPNPGCAPQPPMTPTSQSQQGLWNCQTVGLDLAPCDIDRIQREGHLVTFQANLAGPLAQGDLIAVEIAPIRVSHSFCVDELEIYSTSDDDPPVVTPIQVGAVRIQSESIFQLGNGGYRHAWNYYTDERPRYINITDSRCACATLCACVPAEAHLRMYFVLPQAVDAGDTLTVKFWGRREAWQSVCGSCPVCDICDREQLTAEELASTDDNLYVIE